MFKRHAWKYIFVTILFFHLFNFCMDSWLIRKHNQPFYLLDFMRNGLKSYYNRNLRHLATKQEGHIPNFIGIGIRKCGTGVYCKFLEMHGSFSFPIWKNRETEYFSRRKHLGLQWYLNLFSSPDPNAFYMEKTPHYFYAAPKSIPQDMLQLNPKIKVFLLLCDPTYRAYSCFVHLHAWKFARNISNPLLIVSKFESYVEESVPSLQLKLSKLNKSEQEDFLLQIWNSKFECILAGLYSVHLHRWMKYFNESQMLISNGEDFMKNPGSEYIKLQKFFGVEQRIQPEHWVRDDETGHFCLQYPKNNSQIYCPAKTGRKGRTRSKIPTAIPPSNKTWTILSKFYQPYNEELYQILNKTYHWL